MSKLTSFDILMEKVVRDGMVAVLVSPGYGAGWYSWHGITELLFDPIIVDMVQTDRRDDITPYVKEKYPEEDPYCDGALNLVIKWVPVGAQFRIDEYDGAESVILASKEKWLTA